MIRSEMEFIEWAQAQGWHVTKNGWPDFFCRRDGKVMLVEVKDRTTLTAEQADTLADLDAHGFDTFVWTPVDGLMRYGVRHGRSAAAMIRELEDRVAELQAKVDEFEREKFSQSLYLPGTRHRQMLRERRRQRAMVTRTVARLLGSRSE